MTSYSPASMSYPEPGPPEDPWRPYIRDASGRFSVPQQWIRAVMHQESGGHEYLHGRPITSGAGAMGLMQLMPATYADLQAQYNLGNDPFEPHDNILAGTAYIRQMYQKYGAPAFLAAYNAGPQRLDDYLSSGRSLPNETVDYVASIAPNLGTELAMSGPLAAYASGGSPGRYSPNSYAPVQLASYRVATRRRRSGGTACWHDPDAAYDPDAPCQAAPPAPIQVAQAAPYVPVQSAIAYTPPPSYSGSTGSGSSYGGAGCIRDPDAAYDAACSPRPARSYTPRPTFAAAVIPVSAVSGPPSFGSWTIQVGAFDTVDQARFATTMARQADFTRLAGTQSVVQQTTPFGHGVLYRARLAGLARGDAGSACATLKAQNIPCMVVTPGG